MPSPKAQRFHLIEVKRTGSPSEIKVATTKLAATKLRAQLDTVGQTKDVQVIIMPPAVADKARFVQALLNGEPLTKYLEA